MRNRLPLASCFVLTLGLLAGITVRAEPVALTKLPDRVRVEIGGKLFTEYVFGDGASRPYCYPVLTVDGTSLTRDFPMKPDTPGEETDHPHHRALMFAHGEANGIDFWNEGKAGGNTPKGRTVHDGLVEASSGDTGVLRTRNRWLSPDGTLIATDETTLRFHGDAAGRFLDYEVTIRALADTPLLLGDSKEGTMAIRVAQWLTLPHKYQGQPVAGTGHLLTSTGVRDSEVWGKRAAWCDYYGARDGKVYGVALFDHPLNFRHPTWWMARDYGLFAANPFGQHEFENRKDQPHLGDYTVPAGGALTLRYRFYFHEGDPDAAQVAARYADYATNISGRWTWPMQGRNGGVTPAHATLRFKDGVLTGTVTGRLGEAPIGDATFKDGQIAFTVTREGEGGKVVIKYFGRLEGDTITGKIERPAANEYDAPFLFDWQGTREP